MRRIYYTQRCLMICSREESRDCTRETVLLPDGTAPEEAVGMLLDGTAGPRLALVCEDVTSAYDRIAAGFKQVNAAGGLVRSDGGNFLMIFRNGVWDLPKGHQEPGEAIEDTAGREIAEETAVAGLQRGGLICITDHCYLRDGKWHMKHTWWFGFTSREEVATAPQTEEGISGVVWSRPEDIPSRLENSYPSIREVFEKAI